MILKKMSSEFAIKYEANQFATLVSNYMLMKRMKI